MAYSIEDLTEGDYRELVSVWEASVRATHDFLTEEDIQFYKPLILHEYLKAVTLFCVKDAYKKILGFIGIAGRKIEMLFIDPAARGKGIGKQLLTFVIQQKEVDTVDVNEQNVQAVGFYQHVGFSVTSRSATDGMGKPFPILSMALHK
jgi:putative acetyltransferase